MRKRLPWLLAAILFLVSIFFLKSYLSYRSDYFDLLKERVDFNQKKYEIYKQMTDIEKSLEIMKQRLDRYEYLEKRLNDDSKDAVDKNSLLLLEPLNFLHALTSLLDKYERAGEVLTSYLSYLSVNGSFCKIPSIWPVRGWITSMYGMRRHPILKKRIFHDGIDITHSLNSSVFATASGTVRYIGNRGGYGMTVIIDHGRDIETQYSHLDNALVEEGLSVKKGELIALMGDSGLSTGPHIHYEVRIDGKPQDPLKFIF